MKISDKATWSRLKHIDVDKDQNEASIVEFAEAWANNLEEIMNDGVSMQTAMHVAFRDTPRPKSWAGKAMAVTDANIDSAALILRDCWYCGNKFFKLFCQLTGRRKYATMLKHQDMNASKGKKKGRKHR